MKAIALGLVALACAAVMTAYAQQCGKEAGGAQCPNNLCCSQFGYCGLGGDYCGNGCQSGPCYGATLGAEQCGKQAGGAQCPNNLCCSQWGYCGLGGDYCGTGCQSGPCYSATLGAEQCGKQAGGAKCPNNLCCSQWGYCGLGGDYCGNGCQSGPCNSGTDIAGVAAVVTRDLFDKMLPHRDDPACPARGFYTYDAFFAAAGAFPAFGTTGDDDARKREVAAFLAQTSHDTSGGAYSWGYCYKEVKGATSDHCVPTAQWPCAPGKKYHARGPMQITYNYNYGPVGRAIGADLLANPDLVATDPAVAFKTALWLWMTPRSPEQPSCHDVVTGRWTPTAADRAAGRVPGYGITTNILTGGLQCARGSTDCGRVRFYKRYCDILGVSYGPNLDCDYQGPFDGAVKSSAE